MVRQINRLSARTAETLSKPGRHADGGGLYLAISAEGRRRWVFLYTWRGKLREAGLGAASKVGVSLKAARDKASEGRALVSRITLSDGLVIAAFDGLPSSASRLP